MAGFLDYFKAALIVQLFWSISITMLVASIPSSDLVYLSFASSSPSANSMNTISSNMQTAMDNQTKIPVVDTATLVFYSGNIILDLIGNFVTAIPQMFGLFLNGIFMLFPIDVSLQKTISYFTYAAISILYLFSMLAFVTNMRSGGNLV